VILQSSSGRANAGAGFRPGRMADRRGCILLSPKADNDAHRRSPDVKESHRRAVDRVLAEMRGREEAGLSIHEMADIAYLSPFHFARVFREVTGIAPGEFSTALRMEKAKELLLTTDLSVQGAAFESLAQLRGARRGSRVRAAPGSGGANCSAVTRRVLWAASLYRRRPGWRHDRRHRGDTA